MNRCDRHKISFPYGERCPECPVTPIVPLTQGADAKQIGGNHYKDKSIQPWDYIAGNGIGYLEGNVIKYVSRWQDKGGVQDLEKARHYLDKLIEMQK